MMHLLNTQAVTYKKKVWTFLHQNEKCERRLKANISVQCTLWYQSRKKEVVSIMFGTALNAN